MEKKKRHKTDQAFSMMAVQSIFSRKSHFPQPALCSVNGEMSQKITISLHELFSFDLYLSAQVSPLICLR